MEKTVPFKNTYDTVKSISKYSNLLLYVSTVLYLAIYIVNNQTERFANVTSWVIKINYIFIIGFVVSSIIQDYLLFTARKKKRLDLVDNSFGTLLNSEQSINYFTNDHLKPGIYKLAVNSFENNFFSLNISKAMLPSKIATNAIIATIFFGSAIYGYANLVVLLIQLSITTIMLKEIVKLISFNTFLSNLYFNYCSLFNDLKNSKDNIDSKTASLIYNTLEYESILSWANLLLSEKKYNKLNDQLSNDWILIKQKYQINN